MLFWSFIAFHLVSLAFCWIATRTTIHYLQKHQVTSQHRHLLFGFVRTRYIAFFYVSSITILTLYAIISAIFLYY